MLNQESASRLNQLIELLHDSRDGYKECAEEVKADFFKKLFLHLAQVRDQMINELQQQARLLNVNYEKSGSTLAAGHRLFIDLKSLVTGGEPKTLIEEIKRGENYAIENYEEAVNDNFPAELSQIIRKQLVELKNNLSQIKWHEPVA